VREMVGGVVVEEFAGEDVFPADGVVGEARES
jgi:hypothetical protein